MIFADKLIQLRKREGWSQEDLAAKLNVSRQSVSKWEGATSVPDLDKIMKLSEIFSVTTDYLLKDSMGETIEYSDTYDSSQTCTVTVKEANEYMDLVNRLVPIRSIFIASYVLSPLTLILLSILTDCGVIELTEEQAAA
ncbi:MAG TPA: helix-turn-helix transcriptional regulator [Lachnospiraceae bacterium]|nr:helix-turn-helix transcriptional regulator [Lachnospiraceae bacterium]HPF29413.1 helix-turn-helix transcriptional regulator [Lachnospiraceae bacterium]